jgi:hypothetical protein
MRLYRPGLPRARRSRFREMWRRAAAAWEAAARELIYLICIEKR